MIIASAFHVKYWGCYLLSCRIFNILTTIVVMQTENEVLLQENKDRFVILPIKYPTI